MCFYLVPQNFVNNCSVIPDLMLTYHQWRLVAFTWGQWAVGLNILRPRQNGRRFADDTFKRIFLNENFRISIKISLKFVPKGPINNIPALVQIMTWHRSGDKPLSEPMMVSLLTHICVTLPQWVKTDNGSQWDKSRDHFVYEPSQWETVLHCNVASHWLGTYTKWSLQISPVGRTHVKYER